MTSSEWLVRAVLIAGLTACQSGDSVGVPEDFPAPQGLTVVPVSAGTVRVQWEVNEAAVAYRVERRQDLTGDFTVLVSSLPQSLPGPIVYFDTDLSPDTYYGYRVIALDNLGHTSPPSTVGGARTPPSPGIEVQTFYQGTDPLLADPDGYTAVVEGPETQRAPVGVSATRRFSPLAPGQYAVRLDGVSSACSVQGGAARTASVTDQTAQTIATVQYVVNCRDGTRGDLRVELSVVGSAPAQAQFHVEVSGIANDNSLPESERIYIRTLTYPSAGGATALDGLRPGVYQLTRETLPGQCFGEGPATHQVNLAALARDTVRFTVRCGTSIPNASPVAEANGPYTGVAGSPVTFSSIGSTDPDGTIVSYTWGFGDGTGGSGASPNHTYAAPGSYTVRLTVTDNGGRFATDVAQVTILPTSGGGEPSPTPLTWSNSFSAPQLVGSDTDVFLLMTLDLSANLPETTFGEALSSWVVEALRWDPAVLRLREIQFGPNHIGTADSTAVLQGSLQLSGLVPPPGATGLVQIAVLRFRVIGSAGSATTTATTLGPLTSTPGNGSFNYKPKTKLVEGRFVSGGGSPQIGTVTGTVRNQLGAPLGSVLVTVAPGGTANTSAQGGYSLSVPVGSGTVSLSGLPATCQVPVPKGYNIVSSGQSVTVDFSVSCQGSVETGTVTGTISRSSGGPLAGVTVSAGGSSSATNAEGQYTLAVPVGSGTVAVSGVPAGCTPPAGKPYTIGAAGQSTTVDFTVTCATSSTTGTVTGTVSSSLGGGLAGVTVSAGAVTTTSNAQGQYSLTVAVGSGTVIVTGVPSACTAPAGKPYTIGSPGQSTTVDFTVTCQPAGNTVSGTWTLSGSTATLELRMNITTGNVGDLAGDFFPNSARLVYVAASGDGSANDPGPPTPPVITSSFATSPENVGSGPISFSAFSTAAAGATGNVGIIRLRFTIGAGAAATVQSTISTLQINTNTGQDVTSTFTVSVAPLSLP